AGGRGGPAGDWRCLGGGGGGRGPSRPAWRGPSRGWGLCPEWLLCPVWGGSAERYRPWGCQLLGSSQVDQGMSRLPWIRRRCRTAGAGGCVSGRRGARASTARASRSSDEVTTRYQGSPPIHPIAEIFQESFSNPRAG